MAEVSDGSTKVSEPLSLLEVLGRLAGLVTAVLLILSTAYDFSFLYALGLTFEEVPSSLADHVRSAIVWAPRALLYIALLVMYEMFMRRVEGGLSEEEIVAKSPAPRFFRVFRSSPKVLFGVLIVVAVSSDFFLRASDHSFFLVALVTWGLLASSVVAHPRLGAKFTSTSGRFFVVVPIVIIWIASLGYGRGEALMTATKPTWEVDLKLSEKVEQRRLIGLRRFSTVAILVEPGRRVSVVPAESIVRAAALRSPDADIPRICKWFDVGCVKSG